jgi:hypothetical protein
MFAPEGGKQKYKREMRQQKIICNFHDNILLSI